MDFLKLVRAYFDRGKITLLYICFFICLLLYYLPFNDFKLKLLIPFLFAATFIIIDILSRISLSLRKDDKPKGYILNRQEAFKFIEVEIEKKCKLRGNDKKQLSISVIGLRGRYLTTWLESFIRQNAHQSWFSNIEFYFFLISKEFASKIEGLERYRENISASIQNIDSLSKWAKSDYKLSTKQVNIQLILYDQVNPFHAFLIGNEILVMTYFVPILVKDKVIDWVGPAKNPYYFYKQENNSDRFMIEVVDKWISYHRRKFKRLGFNQKDVDNQVA